MPCQPPALNDPHVPAVARADIVAGLRRVGLAPGDVVLVHSSLSAFGHVAGGADTVIDALLDGLGPEGTAVLPTFTWGRYHAITEPVVFDLARESVKEEMGIIPETFRTRPGVMRSPHLCHSVAALGPHARDVMGTNGHAWGPGSTFAQLETLNAWNLFLGVGTRSCTFLHHVEELMHVPYREHRHYRGSVFLMPDGTRRPCDSVEFIRKYGYRNNFAKMERIFAEHGVLHVARIGRARVLNIRVRDIVRISRAYLEQDIRFLLDESTHPTA
ncbi:MAG: AAC(3) family N-acetyltransferase [Kiritimatiellaeota bacterium]|nr:AAC(3) family N-acetyltransferase [Kiritimatiellota bacterium]